MADFVSIYAVISKAKPLMVGFMMFGDDVETTVIGRDGITKIPIPIDDTIHRAESMNLLVQWLRVCLMV
jgi:hypothetical protein